MHIFKKNNSKKTTALISLTAIFLLLSASVGSAKTDPVQLSLKAKYTGEKVLLRWAPNDMDLEYTYKLYRLADKKETLIGTFGKIPLKKISKTFSADDTKLLTSLLYPQSLYKTDTEKLAAISQRENQKGMAFLLAELKPVVATALGIRAEDPEIEKNKGYGYRLKAYKGGQMIGEKTVVVSTAAETVLFAPAVTGRRYPWGCALRWTRFDSYTAFNIYRSKTENGPFEKISKSPVSVNYIRNKNGTVDAPPFFYSDTTADKKTPVWFYKVSGIDSFGDESPQSDAELAIRDASLRPAPQKPVTTTISEPYIQISWAPDGTGTVKSYNLFRSSLYNGNYEKLNKAPIKTTGFTDKNVKYGVNYFYCHTAVDTNGNESVMSLPQLAVLRDRTPPAVPANLAAVAEKGRVHLSWEPVMDKDLSGYEIYRASSADAADWAMLNKGPLSANRYTDTMASVFDKKPYYYKVLARDKEANRSGYSNMIEIKLPDVTPPKPPVWKGATTETDGLVLEWKASASKDISGYRLYKGRGNVQKKIADLPKTDLKWIDKAATPGIKEWYFITAVDNDNNESEKSSGLEAIRLDKTPVSLSGLTVKYTNPVVIIRLNTSDTDFKTMTIERKREDENRFKKIAINHKMDVYTDKYIDKGKIYSYRLTVYDRSGNLSVSPEIKVITK